MSTTIYVIVVIIIYMSDSYALNYSNILYQYSLVCGSEFYDSIHNVWSFPTIPNEYRICPDCSRNKDCYFYGNCCPDVEIKLPTTKCKNGIILDSTYDQHYQEYEFVTYCPINAKKQINKDCIIYRNVQEMLMNPPVTSEISGLTYMDKNCALCHNDTNTVPWDIQVHNNCTQKLHELSTIDEINQIIVKGQCGYIMYTPPSGVFGPKLCSSTSSKKGILYSSCNVTGTWLKYDEDIDFACRHFDNQFRFYKNIYCYICNPPYFKNTTRVVKECNSTGNWKKYELSMVRACESGEFTSVTYPFKNIFCYVCNIDNAVKNTFYLTIEEQNLFEYYLLEFNNITTLDDVENISHFLEDDWIISEYYRWQHKITCSSILPVSEFDDDLSTILTLSEMANCTISNNKGTGLFIEDFTESNLSLSNEKEKKIPTTAIYLTHKNNICFVRNNSMVDCNNSCYGSSANNLFRAISGMDCTKTHDIYENVDRFPFEYLKCGCFPYSSIVDSGGRKDYSPGAWNLFYIKPYMPISQRCQKNQILDEKEMKCQMIKCYDGKELRDGKCVGKYRHGYGPYIGYTLPFIFIMTNKDENLIDTMIRKLDSDLSITYNISSTFCVRFSGNTSHYSFFLQLDVHPKDMNLESLERQLLNFVNNLTAYANAFGKISFSYDPRSMNIANSGNLSYEDMFTKSKTCVSRFRPLLTEILICRHLVFTPDEYRKVDDTVTINGYQNTYNFYQYHITSNGELWLCENDFISLTKNNITSDNFLYFGIMLTCSALSTIFLSLTLLTYCLFPVMRTVPGKNIMSLVVSMLLHHLTYIVLITTKAVGIQCKILGILVHYFLLTSFGCLFICAWHMFKIFGTESIVSSVEAIQNKHTNRIYFAFAYGYALLIVVGNIIVTSSVTSGRSIGYGDGRCFISFQENVIVTLIIPMVILSVVDISLYSITVYRFGNRKRMGDNDAMDKSDLVIFLKLFTTTGCSWILILINVFIENSLITVIVFALNNLQGLYIFIAYIFNKRVYRMYVSKFGMKNRRGTKNRSPSTSVTILTRIKANSMEQSSPLVKTRKQHDEEM